MNSPHVHLRDLPGIQTVQHGTVEYDMVFGMFMACLFDDTTNAVAREEFQVGGGAKNDKPRSRARYEREFFDEQSKQTRSANPSRSIMAPVMYTFQQIGFTRKFLVLYTL